ncbi:MAG: hypothetical protein AAFQ80_04415 [Cyanobacteria bacterium J06621_8]
MSYLIEQLPNKRWGIYHKKKLLASVSCHNTSFEILRRLHEQEFRTSIRKQYRAKSLKNNSQSAGQAILAVEVK